MRSLRARIVSAFAVVVLALSVTGHMCGVKPVPLSAMAVLAMVGILITAALNARALVTARNQIEAYIKAPEGGVPDDPPPPEELQPFFQCVERAQDELAATRTRLEAEVTRQTSLNQARNRAAEALQAQPTLVARFGALVPVVLKDVSLAVGGYYTWEQIGLAPVLAVWQGDPPAMPERALALSTVEASLTRGQMVWVDSLQAEEAPAALRAWAQDRGLAGAVFVPAVRDGKTIGFLAAFGPEKRAATRSDREFLESLSLPMGWAQHAALRFEAAVESDRVGRTVNSLLTSAGGAFNLEEATTEALGRLHELVPYSRAAILLAEDAEFAEVFTPAREGDSGYFLGSRLRRDGSCAGRVMEGRTIEVDADLRTRRTYQEDPLLVDEGYLSRLAMPLVAGGKAVGCLYLVSRDRGAFTRQNADALRTPLEALSVGLELLRSNRELTQKIASLDVGIAEKGVFLAGLNHEIRSQLKSMMELMEPLLDGQGSPINGPAAEAVQELLARSRQLLGMLDGVVDIERMDAGVQSLRLEEFFVADVIKEVQWDLQALLKARRVEATVELPDGLPPMVADSDRFRSLLYQLMMRAVQATPGAAQVTLRANLISSSWLRQKSRAFVPDHVALAIGPGVDVMLFSIVDQGVPLSPAIRSQMFEEGGAAGQDAEGALKLYFMRRLVEMHRGHVWMEEGPDGMGNRTCLALPQYSLDRVGFVNYVGKRLKEARETLSCLSLVGVRYQECEALRGTLGEERFYRAMKELEGVVRQAVREPIDAVRRFRNGEMIVIFAGADRAGARRIVERLLEKLRSETSSVMASRGEVLTAVATYPDDALRAEDMLRCLETT